MTRSEPSVQDATEKLREHGCPICGAEASFLWVEDLDAIAIHPCGHVVGPEEAAYLEWFQQAIDTKDFNGEK